MEDSIIINLIMKAINTIFSNLFSSIDNAIYPVLDDMVFIDSSILEYTFLEKIMGTTSRNGLLLLANSLLIAFVLYYSTRLIFSYYTGSETESPIRFIVRLILFSILMNSSFVICKAIITFSSYITDFIKELGQILFGSNISFLSLSTLINNTLVASNLDFNIFSIDGIIKIIMSIGIFNVLLSYAFRYVMLKLLVLLCPFAFLCLINKPTEKIFKTWLQSLCSLLILQIIVALILILPHAINNTISTNYSSLFNKLILVGTIYALFKANNFVKEIFGGLSTNVSSGLSTIKNLFTKAY